jgi:hypothetical protein
MLEQSGCSFKGCCGCEYSQGNVVRFSKSKILSAFLVPVAILAFDSSQTFYTITSVGVTPAQYSLSSFSSAGMMWVLILAGCLAIVASSPKVVRVISAVLGLLSLWNSYVLISHYLTFPQWLSSSLYSEGDRAQLLTLPWLFALLGLIITALVSLASFASAASWTTTRKYDRIPTPTNPWSAIDQGIDPTVD